MNAISINKKWSAFFFVLAAMFFLPGNAHAYLANQCAADRFGDDLNCTANDVSITGMRVVGDTTACVGGTDISLDLEMTINFAMPDRWDIGVFVSNDGNSPQLRAASGGAATCSVSVLPTASPFLNLDSDGCGDGNGTIGGGTGGGIHYMTNVSVPCQSLPGSGGKLYIPFVVSWDNQSSPSGDTCNSNEDPVPNTKSKCNAPTILQGTIDVVVLPNITKSDGLNKDTLFSGDTTTYDVTITNSTGVSLSGAVFKDPAVSGIAVSGVSCSAAGGAACPASSTVAAMQGAGIAIPDMPVGGSVTFSITAILTGTASTTLTNTAYVTVGSQTNSASDSNMIVDSIFIDPPTQAKTGDKGATVSYTYTLYNYGVTTDTVNLSVASSKGWIVTRSPTTATLAPGESTTVTVTVAVPGGAAVGTLDTTTLTGYSTATGKTATATAVTTVTSVLTLAPSNTGAGGAGTHVYYAHRVQNNANSSKGVSLTPSFTAGTCTGWTSALYEADKSTPMASPLTLAANGGYKDFILGIHIPTGTAAGTTCTASLAAAYTSGAANAVTVTDVTTVKNLLLYEDPAYTTEQYTYPAGNAVYGKSFGLTDGQPYYYRWIDPTGTVRRYSPVTNNLVSLPDTYEIPTAGPLGTWTVQICNNATTATCTIFTQTNFYVGPDHLQASYSGAAPTTNTSVLIDLALHDKFNHTVPFDASGNLVRGDPVDPEGPLMITVTVSGSAEIVDDPLLTTLGNYTISGQTITGRLSSTTGTAQIVIRSAVAGEVTVTPASYKGALYGSTVRDEPVTLDFEIGGPDHYELSLPTSGIACLPTTVTVTACSDNSSPCTSPFAAASGQTATLATSAGTLGSATVTFNASGVASTTLSYPAATDGAEASVTLSGVQTAAANSHQCCPDGTSCVVTNSCSTAFHTAGFIFSASAGGGVAAIPTQVAGVSSGTYYLRAVKTLDNSSHTCGAALTGAKSINLGYECNDPATCYGANLMSVNGGTATAIARNNNGSVSGYTSVNMTFDANGNAPFTFAYSDVGYVKLWANTTVNSALLTGSSNSFLVKPFDFGVISCAASVVGDCVAAPADPGLAGGGGVFAKAGEAFKATVTARAFGGAATPSFGAGSNNGTETVNLTRTRVAPTGVGAVDGALGGTTAIPRSNFSNGIATASDLSWSEVGVITLTATNSTFLGNALTTTGTTGNIGRFYPEHFDTAVTLSVGVPMPCPTGLSCPASNDLQDGFVYSGQAFTAQVTAKNLAGSTTQNYDGTLGYAKAVTLTAWDALGSIVTENPPNPPGGSLLMNNAIIAALFGTGVATTGTPTYTFGTVPTAPTDIYLRAAESAGGDGVTSLRAASVEGGVKVVSGRIKVSNAYGSELLPLTLTATAQYFGGATEGWVNSVTDDATGLTLEGTSPVGSGTTEVTPLSGTLTDGELDINLDVPSAGPGVATITPAVVGCAAPPAACYLPLISGAGTFGVYKGNNRYIYRRERY